VVDTGPRGHWGVSPQTPRDFRKAPLRFRKFSLRFRKLSLRFRKLPCFQKALLCFHKLSRKMWVNRRSLYPSLRDMEEDVFQALGFAGELDDGKVGFDDFSQQDGLSCFVAIVIQGDDARTH